MIRPNFSLVHQNLLGQRGGWGLKGAWKLNVGLVQTYHIDGGQIDGGGDPWRWKFTDLDALTDDNCIEMVLGLWFFKWFHCSFLCL